MEESNVVQKTEDLDQSRLFGEPEISLVESVVEAPATGQLETVVPQLYTDEEYESIPTEQIDESRLTSVQRKFYAKEKNLESGYQKKFQTLAQERQLQAQRPPQPQVTPEDELFNSYLQNPQGTIAEINQTIRKFRHENPDDERIDKLEDMKDNLHVRAIQYTAQFTVQRDMVLRQAAAQNQYWTELKGAVPELFTPEGQINEDFRQKVRTFAKTKFGYSDAELDNLSTVKNTKTMVNLYKESEVAKGDIAKITRKKKEPSKVEPAGSGFETTPKESKWGDEEKIAFLQKTRAGSFGG